MGGRKVKGLKGRISLGIEPTPGLCDCALDNYALRVVTSSVWLNVNFWEEYRNEEFCF
jgi:hypothetical protein